MKLRPPLLRYAVRLESKHAGDATRLLFCTVGVLLRRLAAGDAALAGVSHVVVDEVHERGAQGDVLVTALRALVAPGGPRPDLKVVLMSATADAELFGRYFARSPLRPAPVLKVEGRLFPVATYYLEDVLDATGYVVAEGDAHGHPL